MSRPSHKLTVDQADAGRGVLINRRGMVETYRLASGASFRLILRRKVSGKSVYSVRELESETQTGFEIVKLKRKGRGREQRKGKGWNLRSRGREVRRSLRFHFRISAMKVSASMRTVSSNTERYMRAYEDFLDLENIQRRFSDSMRPLDSFHNHCEFEITAYASRTRRPQTSWCLRQHSTSQLFAAPSTAPLSVSHPLRSTTLSSRAIRWLSHREIRRTHETRYSCSSSLFLRPSRRPRCCVFPELLAPPQLQRSAVRLSSVNLPVPLSGAFSSFSKRFSSHCQSCACYRARNDFPCTCGGPLLARVVDYPSALHLLAASKLRHLRGHSLLHPPILPFILFVLSLSFKMISATSFMNPIGSRPPRYRTPSPPRRAVEPISPCSTAENRTSRTDREGSGLQPFENPHSTSDNNRFSPADVPPSHRSGHGRSSSTIDTLATVALATSPTFAPSSFHPPSQRSTPPLPIFPSEAAEPIERPAKRSRSEKAQSPYTHPRSNAVSSADPPSISDSMKTDAELLLNFARPTNPHAPIHSKRVSADESYNNSAFHAQGQIKGSNGATTTHWSPNNEGVILNSTIYNLPPSRMRSQSDGSAAISRPMIQGLRPNTSASTFPSIAWQGDTDGRDRDSKFGSKAIVDNSQIGFQKPQETMPIFPQNRPTEKENDAHIPRSSQANCASCNLVRIPIDNEDQGDVTWISCDGCKRWFHIVCAGFKNDREIRTVDKFICKTCRPIHGQTTFVRKSSRARTSIDYAGLNQGLVKAASDSLEHHYIEPFKQGRIRFLPENFPRMRPELVNSEYFDRSTGMTEPIVIPAEFNTPVGSIGEPEFDALVGDASTQEMFDELLDHLPSDEHETVIDCGQDRLDMVLPRELSVRAVSELYGPEERVEVIDVKSQNGEDKRWTMQKWADYYESTGSKVVRNVISLEISQSKLGRLIRRPKIVRDLDLQDAVWPEELKAVGNYPKVQFYCLMSVADCYTDFHIDFGGSSVYYHILKGKKTFFFIPPKEKHLKKYEEWCNSPAQDSTFLGDQTKECYRVDLCEGDTMLIPSGWIHAVWTPENSLVIGGNFLTRLNYGMQIKIAKIEKDTKVPMKFRYPFFQKIQWYTILKYLQEDPVPQAVMDAFAQDENYRFHREYPVYYEFGERANTEPAGTPYHNSRFYSQAELEGLPDLAKYLLRTALIAGSYLVEGVTVDSRNAVKRSIPAMPGEPIDTIRTFGIWLAWKRGNESAAHWTRPGVVESNPKLSLTEKKPAGRPSRRSERNVENQRTYAERQAVQRSTERPADDSQGDSGIEDSSTAPLFDSAPLPLPQPISAPAPAPPALEEAIPKPRVTSRGSGLGPKRVACDGCRKRRIRCHHKEENSGGLGQQMAIGASGLGHHTPTAQDAASALNSLAAIASGAGLSNGLHGIKRLDRMDVSQNYATSMTAAPHGPAVKVGDASPEGANSAKKGRSKACDDCRKSKVRLFTRNCPY